MVFTSLIGSRLITNLVEFADESAVVLANAKPDSRGRMNVHPFGRTATEAHSLQAEGRTGEESWLVAQQRKFQESLTATESRARAYFAKNPKGNCDSGSAVAITPDGALVVLAAYSGFKRAVIRMSPMRLEIDQLVGPKTLNGTSLRGTGVIALTPPGVLGVYRDLCDGPLCCE